MSGVFQVDRSIFEHGIWNNVAEFRIFLYILGKAVWREEGTKVGNVNIARGQYLRSYRNLREDLMYIENNAVKHYAISHIKDITDKFVEEGRLKKEETELGTLFTVVNYELYQGFERFQKDSTEQPENGEKTEQEQNKNNKKKGKKDKKGNKENISLQISNLRLRYSDQQLKVIDNYFDILQWTRVHGKIADSVILKIYQKWEEYHPDRVIYGLNVYINNPKHHDKKENYTYAIIRNAKAEDVYKGVNSGGEYEGHNGKSEKRGGPSEESLRLERIAKEQGLIGADGSVGEIPEVDF